MPKIAAIGEEDLVLGFRGVGVEVVPTRTSDDTAVQLHRLAASRQYAVILITESMAAKCMDEVARVRDRGEAIVLIIPSHRGSEGLSLMEMKRQIERSIGVDMITKE